MAVCSLSVFVQLHSGEEQLGLWSEIYTIRSTELINQYGDTSTLTGYEYCYWIMSLKYTGRTVQIQAHNTVVDMTRKHSDIIGNQQVTKFW
jgi:hypothetical protein